MGEPSTSEGRKGKVRVFISYSWDDDEHREWVRKLASRLRADGVDARLDMWHTGPGDRTPEFMKREVDESDFILCICTPRYKERFDKHIGGVGYEGELLETAHFTNRDQKKFIPILRKAEWKQSAPSWLAATYYVDLTGNPYSEDKYNHELLATLLGNQEKAPSLGGKLILSRSANQKNEFVNRDIELASLDPSKLHQTYWQYALISAPTGFGKTYLINRLIDNIQNDPELNNKWAYSYIDIRGRGNSFQAIRYMVEQITGEPVPIDMDEKKLKEKLCNHVHEKMCISSDDGPLKHILLLIDSVDFGNSAVVEWFSSVLHDVIVDSYADYEMDKASFVIRILIAGTDTETFLLNYLNWESASEKYRLKPPRKLVLSAFDDWPVQELIQRRAVKESIILESAIIQDISFELQYLSGGHPEVVTSILEELATRKFRKYKDFLRQNHEQLIKIFVSEVAEKVLRSFPLIQSQKDIKTVCVFRLINLNTLRELREKNLVQAQMDIEFLGQLCMNNILTPPNGENFFYHDDIIRRILYLDLSYGMGNNDKHIQRTHKCAKSLYSEWIQSSHHSPHLFFAEWLFHSLQITDHSNESIILEWKKLMSSINTNYLPLSDVRRVISEKLNSDGEVKYLFRERFKLGDFSLLFDS